MKVIVAGSRSISSYDTVYETIRDAPFTPVEIVHGGADGVDTQAAAYAEREGVTESVFEPDWDEHGKAAGPIRNHEMAKFADALIAIWDGESPGTENMIERALTMGLDVYVRQVRDVPKQ